jgi:hypothetical protein
MKILNKLSVKTVVGNVPTRDVEIPKMENGSPVLDKDKKVVMQTVQRGIKQEIMRVYGQCDRIKLGNTSFGETVEFQGTFEAVNILTGEVNRSPRLFLPPTLTEMVRAEVVAAGDKGVQFAFDIGIDSANNAHGFQYTITPLAAPAQNDPLAQMAATLLANAPALPAPAKTNVVDIGAKEAETVAENEPETEAPVKAKAGKK